jgi:hypothetical protein
MSNVKITMKNLKMSMFILSALSPFAVFACAGSPSFLERLALPVFLIAVIFLLLSFFIKRKNQKISKLFTALFLSLILISLAISYTGVFIFLVLWFFSLPTLLILFLLYSTSKYYKGKNQTIHNVCFSLFIILGLIILFYIVVGSSSWTGCSTSTF